MTSNNDDETFNCLLFFAMVLAVGLALCGGCVNQYKTRVSVDVPPGAAAGPITITVEDRGDQVPTTTKNVIPTVTAPGIPGL
jgi:hypothetical protein